MYAKKLVTITIIWHIWQQPQEDHLGGCTPYSNHCMGIIGYENLYESYIDPIMNYASGVWGFGNFEAPRVLLNRIMCDHFGGIDMLQLQLPKWK